ncbi:hypothetical protein CMK22_00890 [Candidatus Poribacteria bacterium]|nr:hypothetical protein [Candidatus Poribacteria bacterium]
MPQVVIGHTDDLKSLEPIYDSFHDAHPELKIGYEEFEGEGEFTAQHEGIRFIWIEQGEGEVYLDVGYRTQEGDGEKLPDCYTSEKVDTENLPILQAIAENLDTLHPKVLLHVESILSRFDGEITTGDISNEIRLMVETGIDQVDWTSRPKVRRSFELLLENYSQMGWSTKQEGSFEPIKVGDQLTVTTDEPVRVRGKFRYWWIEDTSIFMTHVTTVRRLNYIKNAATKPSEFLGLAMPWLCYTETEDKLDGVNSVNNHVFHITDQNSQTHYHPSEAIGGGKPQHEIHIALEPNALGIEIQKHDSYIDIFPEVEDLTVHQKIELSPGTVVYIPPATGHRTVNAVVSVLGIPGFKLNNTILLD